MKALQISQMMFLLREAAAGLRAIHQLSIVHRDVKAANVCLSSGRAVCMVHQYQSRRRFAGADA